MTDERVLEKKKRKRERDHSSKLRREWGHSSLPFLLFIDGPGCWYHCDHVCCEYHPKAMHINYGMRRREEQQKKKRSPNPNVFAFQEKYIGIFLWIKNESY